MPDQVGSHLGRLRAGLQAHLTAAALGPLHRGQGQGLQAHGQEQLAARCLRIQAGGHQLEAAVQQAFGTATGRTHQLSPGPAVLTVQLLQGPKAGAVGQAATGQGRVEASGIEGFGPCWCLAWREGGIFLR